MSNFKEFGFDGVLQMEVPPGFEPGHRSFADSCLTTWLRYRVSDKLLPDKKMERITRLELATSTLARWRSTR